MNRQQFERARQEFKRVLTISSNNFWGWLFTGISLVQLDSLENSLPCLEKALEMMPEDPLGNYYLGSVLTQMNRSKEAIPYLEKALSIRPTWISAMSALAGAYDNLKEFTISDSLFQSVLKLEPDNALVLNNYGYSLSERGIRLVDALQMAKKALEKDPENGAYLDTVGWIYFKMGEYDKALPFIEKAFTKRTDSDVVGNHLETVYEKLGMKEKARATREKTINQNQEKTETLQSQKNRIE
jgi:tetratricopeptide (TPR) repeat protein